jgi:Zn-dependent peptidase ImmA (M78 family)/transcriptional regulator with XRE-family HTH domain
LKIAVFKITIVALEYRMQELPTSIAIGRRIALARSAKGLNQGELARALGIASHQSISELEKGNRGLAAEELGKLAEVLDQSIDYFVDPFALTGEADYSWRRSPGTPDEVVKAFESRANNLVGLLRWIRSRDEESLNPLKSTLRLSGLSTFEEALSAGEQLAANLKLGPVPAEKLLDKVESSLDVPVLHLDMNPRRGKDPISGATIHLPNFTCILINRNEPAGRRMFDLAHELFHALTWDALRPANLESNAIESRSTAKKDRVEQLANNFASALLMPRALLEPKFQRANAEDLEDLRALAFHFRVSPAALAWRLFALRWIESPVRDKLTRLSTDDLNVERPRLYSTRFVRPLFQALAAGQLSPRKAAKLLDMNLDDLESLFRDHGIETPLDF